MIQTDSASVADWSEEEIRLIVVDYFDMLQAELAGTQYNKTAHRRVLLEQLPKRSAGAVEFKHCNISAVLASQGLPYIDGYKPRTNFQGSLQEAILTYINDEPEQIRAIVTLESSAIADKPNARAFSIDTIEVPPPTSLSRILSALPHASRAVDWPTLSAHRNALGEQGETFVLELERRYLHQNNRTDLAEKLEWTSHVRGDGAGFDISSFDLEGREKRIEVKTTNGNEDPILCDGYRGCIFKEPTRSLLDLPCVQLFGKSRIV
jgi:hypothetical protein